MVTMTLTESEAFRRSRVYGILSQFFLYPEPELTEVMPGYAPVLRQALAAPPYETVYSGTDVWIKVQQTADIAGCYRAFGADARETGGRVDFLATELQFLYLLCLKEAIAGTEDSLEAMAICRDAQRQFLTEHLGVWLPRLVARLEQINGTGFYPALAGLAAIWVESDLGRLSQAR
jgi:putative dimethyl sulfoxide reductase chaperone